MTATALDVLSLSRMKEELRIDDSEASQNAILTGQIQASVDYIEAATGLILVDRVSTVRVDPVADRSKPIFVEATQVRELSAVRYWDPSTGELRLPANSTIALAALGRIQRDEGDRGVLVWPPAEGWPTVLQGSVFEFDVKRGVEADQVPEALVQAAILCCRQLYDGLHEIRPASAFWALARPYRRT